MLSFVPLLDLLLRGSVQVLRAAINGALIAIAAYYAAVYKTHSEE